MKKEPWLRRGKTALGKTSRFENRVYLTANEDGGYTLPEGISKDLLYYVVEDYAGNRDFASLADLLVLRIVVGLKYRF